MSIPGLSPVMAGDVVCMDCSGVLRREIMVGKKNRLLRVEYYCDTCKYGVSATMQHLSTTNIPYDGKVVPTATPTDQPQEQAEATGTNWKKKRWQGQPS